MLLSFKDLRKVIIDKCCDVMESDNVLDRYEFTIDLVRMENIFKQKKQPLHAIGFEKTIKSRVPNINDIQLLSEYLNETDLQNILNNKSEICNFMIFSKENIDGTFELCKSDNEEEYMTDKELFDRLNGKEIDQNIICYITSKLPVYKIIVARTFVKEHDKFEYKLYIRSNVHMYNYYNHLKNENKLEENN